MSYDLAVWEGTRPKTSAEAKKKFEALFARYQEAAKSPAPRPAIRRYVEALLAKYPDLDDDNEDVCPWSDAPLINNATGPILYFAMVSAWRSLRAPSRRSSPRLTGSCASIRN